MRIQILILMTMINFNSQGQNTKKNMSGELSGINDNQKVTVINFTKLETIINKRDNKLYVVNFWATWCRPCVMELPDFMEVNKIYHKNPKFKMILVSLDLAKEAETIVQSFLVKNKMNVEVYLLDDNKRMNQWIPAIDSKWSGAIPATVFYRNGIKLDFKESKMGKSELIEIINKNL
jgi:thiol-disulfide isomerase/thioredoxin